jgi:putative inorganic carbon (hco3(-)) transporter
MRGVLLGVVFFALLPRIFTRGPFAGILMWFWIALMVPQAFVWSGVFTSIPYSLIVGVCTLISFLLARNEPKLPPVNKTTVLLLTLMVWISITTWCGIGPRDQAFDKWQLSEKMLLMSLVAFALVNTQTRVEQLLTVCTLSIAFWGLKGGLFVFMSGGGARVYGPRGSMIADNNDLGVALTMILPLIFYLRDRYRNVAFKWPVQILIGLVILGDIFTYSRGALVAITAMGAALWVRSRHKLQILVMIALAGGGLWFAAPTAWTNRMMTIGHYNTDLSAESRLLEWQRTWVFAQKSPIVGGGFHWSYDMNLVNRLMAGTGLPLLTRPLAAHSTWFEMLGDHGFFGLGLFVSIVASAFFDAQWLIKFTRRDPDLLWANNLGRMIQVALIGYCTGASFATQGMYDGFYAIVIITAAARRVVAAELAGRKVAGQFGTNLATVGKPGGALSPQPSG